jgi:3'-5' exoribonuclease
MKNHSGDGEARCSWLEYAQREERGSATNVARLRRSATIVFIRQIAAILRLDMPCRDSMDCMMELHTISSLKHAALNGRLEARIHVQIDQLTRKETREGKPFYEIAVADAEARLVLRAWSDGAAFPVCQGLRSGAFLEVAGEFSIGPTYGLESRRWTCRELDAAEQAALLAGPPELRDKQQRDFTFIETCVAQLRDPRLRALSQLFLHDHDERFRRAAAARGNHHARRGGLVEHVAQMMRSAGAVGDAYPFLNRDLLLAGVLFHDAGKLWENAFLLDGFLMPFDERGELLGHITIGIELVNTLWRKMLATEEAAGWGALHPAHEDVRLHLLHLIAAHHGELQFGSPIVPKTPEAWALHHVDNLDAKLEMISAASSAKLLAPRIHERVWPLPGNSVTPLAAFAPIRDTSES